MARAQLNYLVTTSSVDGTMQVVGGATVTVRKASDSTLATPYSADIGGSVLPNPLTSDSYGKVSAWFDSGEYVLQIQRSGSPAYTEYWESVPAIDLPSTESNVPWQSYTLEDDYGAPASGSVQVALQAAVNDILTVKGGGRILLADRAYDFDSITWPIVSLDKPPAVIEFVGPVRPPTVGFMPGTGLTLAQGGDMPAPTKGAILRATLASGSAFGNISVHSNIVASFRDLIVRVPTNPQWHGIDAGWLENASLDGVVVDQGRSWGDGSNPLSPGPILESTNAGVIGVAMPGEGNGGVSRARDLLVTGYYWGLQHSEHFDGERVTLAKNINGLRPVDGWHAARHSRLSLYWNRYGITPSRFVTSHPTVPLDIQQLDTEEDPIGGNWYTTVYHINDPNNYLRGQARFRRVTPLSGPNISFRRRGGAYFSTGPLNTPARGMIDAVGFEGANSATVLPASAAGQPVTQLRGTWGISGQYAYLGTVSGSTAGDLAVWDFGTSQISLHTTVKAPVNPAFADLGIAMCVIDSNNYLFAVVGPGNCSIQKVDATAYTNLSGNTTLAVAASQEFDVRVTILGKTIRLYIDGVLMRTYTLTSAEATKYFASNQHGFFAFTSGFEPGGANGGRWSFLRAEPTGVLLA